MKYTNYLWIFAILVLLYMVFHMIHMLSLSGFIYFGGKEGFNNQTVTVNMPINTPYSCNNFCGPTSRCAITGQQCFTDMDCPGCKLNTTNHVQGDNDAGKLTVSQSPEYSSLTSGYGTQQLMLEHSKKPSQSNVGINTWKSGYNKTKQLFDSRYKPTNLEFMPQYTNTYSLTGEFSSDGPLPANY